MKRTTIILIALIGITLCANLVSASFQAKPGTTISLRLTDYKVTTDTPILPDWKPSRIRWQLIDPNGNIKYFVDSDIDIITQLPGGFLEMQTHWLITEDSGTMKIPAFAKTGIWKLNILFYDKWFIFVSKKGVNIYDITVNEGSISDNLVAPLTTTFSIPLIGDYAIAIDLIYIIAIVIILPMLFLSFMALKPSRRKPHVG